MVTADDNKMNLLTDLVRRPGGTGRDVRGSVDVLRGHVQANVVDRKIAEPHKLHRNLQLVDEIGRWALTRVEAEARALPARREDGVSTFGADNRILDRERRPTDEDRRKIEA